MPRVSRSKKPTELARTIFFVLWGWCLVLPTALAQPRADSTRHTVRVTPFVAPAVLLAGGLATQGAVSRDLRREVLNQFPGFHTRADDLLQFAPTVAVLGLSTVGVRGRHELADQLVLTVLSHGLSQAVTLGLKYTVRYPRPDGNGLEAFPSGHTTFAFTGAALLSREYGRRSIWFPVAGYGVATTVGALRVLNNRHWLADVLFGAGVGIGATEAVYAAYPWLQGKGFKSRNSAILPTFDGARMGICWVAVF